jgi:TraB family protein
MPLSRRHFIGITASAVALAYKPANAQDDRALFWRIETPDGGRGVVFGYARVAAAVAPEVTKDGVRFMESAKRVVLDMNNSRFPAMKVDPTLPPFLPRLDPARAQQVRSVLTSMHLQPAQFETLPGFFIASLLYAEGQTNPVPSVGGVIAERAKALGRPMTVLLEPSDVEHLRKPVDFARVDQGVDQATIELLLEARQRVGPIGAYSERLYRERKGEELERFAKTMREHGVPESQTYLDAEAAREMLLARLPAALRSQQPDDSAFCLLPIGMLAGPKSILAALRNRGAHTTSLA